MDGNKAMADGDEAPNKGEQQERARANLKNDDATGSNDGTTIEEALEGSSSSGNQQQRAKRKQTVYKSSLRKRNNEKSRRIQCNEAMDQLLELIIQVQPARGSLAGMNPGNVSMITNRGELIERAVDVMKRLIEENKSQQSRIEELQRALASQPNLLGRGSSVSGMVAPLGATPQFGAGGQGLPQLLNQVTVPTNLIASQHQAASGAIMSNLATHLNSAPTESLQAAALLQRGGNPFVLPPQPGSNLLQPPQLASLLLEQNLQANQGLMYQGAMASPLLWPRQALLAPIPAYPSVSANARGGIDINVSSSSVAAKPEGSFGESP